MNGVLVSSCQSDPHDIGEGWTVIVSLREPDHKGWQDGSRR